LNALSGHTHLLRADVWFAPAMLFGGNEKLLHAARQAGLAVSVDLNWDPRWGRADPAEIQARKAAMRAVLPLVNLAHGNVRELREFTDAPDLETALKRLASWGVEAVVVHLGSDGAGYYREGRLIVEPAAPVRETIHSTGCGDVLSVCLMLLHHRSDLEISSRLRLANQIVGEFMEGRRQLIPPLEDGS
jgi:sugar/nucleoside kinase (ribokinase family)